MSNIYLNVKVAKRQHIQEPRLPPIRTSGAGVDANPTSYRNPPSASQSIWIFVSIPVSFYCLPAEITEVSGDDRKNTGRKERE
jgi:hypothetical protein